MSERVHALWVFLTAPFPLYVLAIVLIGMILTAITDAARNRGPKVTTTYWYGGTQISRAEYRALGGRDD